jgi:hypothetical protein
MVNDDPCDERDHHAEHDNDADNLDDSVAPFLLRTLRGGLAHASTLAPGFVDFGAPAGGATTASCADDSPRRRRPAYTRW